MAENRPLSWGTKAWKEAKEKGLLTPPEPEEEPVPTGEFEWHVMGASTIQGVQRELTKRSNEGWELISSHFEDTGALTGAGRHVLIFRRHRNIAAPKPVAEPADNDKGWA